MDTHIISRHDGVAVVEVTLGRAETRTGLDEAYSTIAKQTGVTPAEGVSPHDAILASSMGFEPDELSQVAERLVVERFASRACDAARIRALVRPRCHIDATFGAGPADGGSSAAEEKTCGLHFTMDVFETPQASISSWDPVVLERVPVTVASDELDAQVDYIVAGSAHVEGDYRIIPALSDAWVASNIPGCSTVEQLRERVRADMLARKEKQAEDERMSRCVAAFTRRLAVELPKQAVEQALSEARAAFEQNLARKGRNRATFLAEAKMTAEELEERQRADVIEQMRRGIALDLLAEHLGLEESPDQRSERSFERSSEKRRLRAAEWLMESARFE